MTPRLLARASRRLSARVRHAGRHIHRRVAWRAKPSGRRPRRGRLRVDRDGTVRGDGHSTVWVRRRLRAAVEAGLVVETMKRIRALGGRPALVPAYRFAGKAPRK